MSMHAYFKSVNLDGFANWMYYQAQEELEQSMKFYDFVIQRGGKVQLAQIEAPPTEWDGPLAVFEATLAHEQKVTGLINDLVEIALEEHDHATNIFLQWFVSEQVEEEESVGGVLEQLKLMGDAKGGLFMIDRELAKRSPSGGSEESE
jgi:ferritin